MVAPDFNHNPSTEPAIIQPTREVFAYNVAQSLFFQASSPENKACRYHRNTKEDGIKNLQFQLNRRSRRMSTLA